MRVRPVLLLLTVGITVAACTAGGGGGGGDNDDDAATTPTAEPTPEVPLTVALSPTSFVLSLAGSFQVDATVTRLPGFESAMVEVALGDPSVSGVTADPIVLNSGETSALLLIYASPAATVGGPFPLGITLDTADPLALDVTTQVMVIVSDGGL